MSVKPGMSLGGHTHFHRNEHWVVVNGVARVEMCDLGEEVRDDGAEVRDVRKDVQADVNGASRVEMSDDVWMDVKIVCENQSAYIPAGVRHRIGNAGKVPLVMIEAQSGYYFGKNDILTGEILK